MKNDYTIREIRPEDDQQIEGVIRACLIEFGADHEGTAWADPELGRLSGVYTGAGNRYWVALDPDGHVVAGVGIGGYPGAEGVCELQKLYCLPEARGTGLARELMDTALAYAKEHYRRCYLETLENMTAAQKLYEKYGFVRTWDPPVDTGHFNCDVRYIRDL